MTRGRALGLQAAVSVLALAGVIWWFSRQDMPQLPSFDEAVGPLSAAVALYLLATLLRGERWFRLVRRGSRRDAYALTTVGYMGNNALPARAGDILKAMLTAHHGGVARRHAFGTLVAERLLDALALGLVFAAVVLAGDLPLGLSSTTLALVAAGMALVVVVALVLAPRLRGLIAGLLAPSRELLSPRGGALLALSAFLWLAEGGVYAVLGKVAGVPLSLSDGMYVMALANIAAMVPAAPGYIGTFDAAVVLGVRLAGAGSSAVALPYVVLVRFVLFVPITLVGLVLLLSRYGGLATARAALRAQPAEAA
ncbi:MAG: lysylphosphatidylglycerol synthase transmembrane domain-containing protein [Solirubrobacteraceae bacterium]